jgi:hypothetical protein
MNISVSIFLHRNKGKISSIKEKKSIQACLNKLKTKEGRKFILVKRLNPQIPFEPQEIPLICDMINKIINI